MIKKQLFGTIKNEKIYLIKIINNKGNVVRLSNYGALIQSIIIKDKFNKANDIVLGFDQLEDYINDKHFIGVIVGRFANRIKNAEFIMDKQKIMLEKNHGNHHLHGGTKTLAKKIWSIEQIHEDPEKAFVIFKTESQAGESGFPGNISVKIKYQFNSKNELSIDFYTETDSKTVLNLTNHTYFNFNTDKTKNILNHIFHINAKKILDTDNENIPTGNYIEIANSKFNFNHPRQIQKIIFNNNFFGYDHHYVIHDNNLLKYCASAYNADTGIYLKILSDYPGMQFYTANFLTNDIIGKNGVNYYKYAGFCMENHFFPDFPNHKNFHGGFIDCNKKYQQKIIYKFGIK